MNPAASKVLVSSSGNPGARPWRVQLIAGKRRHFPIAALAAVLVIAAFLLYAGTHRFHAEPPSPQPLHDKK
jgi:hypothetical protein